MTAGACRCAQLAEITVANGATIIARRENQRQITVRTNIRGRDQGGFVEEAQQAASDEEIKLPAGYQVTLGRDVRESGARATAAVL